MAFIFIFIIEFQDEKGFVCSCLPWTGAFCCHYWYTRNNTVPFSSAYSCST